jgi:hypothetical protein
MRKYAYGWITLGFFLGSLLLHWYFGWHAFVEEAQAHGQAAEMSSYTNEMLQLLWQVLGLAYFLYVGSPASHENDDRTEVKIDAILRAVGGEKADSLIAKIDHEYERHSGHTPHGHGTKLAKEAGHGLGAHPGKEA